MQSVIRSPRSSLHAMFGAAKEFSDAFDILNVSKNELIIFKPHGSNNSCQPIIYEKVVL